MKSFQFSSKCIHTTFHSEKSKISSFSVIAEQSTFFSAHMAREFSVYLNLQVKRYGTYILQLVAIGEWLLIFLLVLLRILRDIYTKVFKLLITRYKNIENVML